MDNLNISFETNNLKYKAKSFDINKNILYVDMYDMKDKFIKQTTLKMGQIPKKVKQKLNPLK